MGLCVVAARAEFVRVAVSLWDCTGLVNEYVLVSGWSLACPCLVRAFSLLRSRVSSFRPSTLLLAACSRRLLCCARCPGCDSSLTAKGGSSLIGRCGCEGRLYQLSVICVEVNE